MCNGYPRKLLFDMQTFTITLRDKFGMGPIIRDNINGDDKQDIYMQLPYGGPRSEALARAINKTVNKACVGNFRVKVTFNKRKIGNLFNFKDKLDFACDNNYVYRVNCPDCQSFYVGESKRRFRDRLGEHNSESFGGSMGIFYRHSLESGHKPSDLSHCAILGRNRNWYRRRLRESLLVGDLKPNLNDNVTSVKLNLF